jgi:pyruvate dehydrogenase E2 component (dihydrolipoamide acetyltransferase)
MTKDLYIPKLGQTVEEVRIVSWLKEDGSQVKQGEEVLEVETDKAIFPIEATAKGFLHIGPFEEDQVVPVLTVVAVIGGPDDQFEIRKERDASTPPPRETKRTTEKKAEPSEEKPNATMGSKGRIIASPRAKMRAEALGIPLESTTPTGNDGRRVVEADILRAAREHALTKDTGDLPDIQSRSPLEGIRAITARRMAQSAQTVARVTLLMEVDATDLVEERKALVNALATEWGCKPGYNEMLGVLTARALKAHPYMNARLEGDAILEMAHINLGFAVDTPRGLLVPVIPEIENKDLKTICQEYADLVNKARNSRIQPGSLEGGTFTLTSLGAYGIDAFTPIINLPETAILGIGRIAERPVVVNHALTIRYTLTLSLAFDHRLVDGAPAAKFLQTLREMIENPDLRNGYN